VIVTHQSRPGKKDFTTLEGHAERLEGLLQRKVRYIDDIFGQCARDAVRKMKNGDVLMLENVRFNAEENLTLNPDEASKTYIARKLSQMADIFVNDAFGTSHRSQPTMVGLPMVMRSVAGLLMEKRSPLCPGSSRTLRARSAWCSEERKLTTPSPLPSMCSPRGLRISLL